MAHTLPALPYALDALDPHISRSTLEIHHGKFRHGQLSGSDLGRTVIHLDRAHCFLEADEARLAFSGSHLYPGVEAL